MPSTWLLSSMPGRLECGIQIGLYLGFRVLHSMEIETKRPVRERLMEYQQAAKARNICNPLGSTLQHSDMPTPSPGEHTTTSTPTPGEHTTT